MNMIEQSQQQEPPRQPRTIEELRQWYADHHLPPPTVTRFFIGTDYREPKAFGIYKNEQGECIVYKNKADGTRAVRYRGPDEAFAVGEILQKLKEEIASRKGGGGRGAWGRKQKSAELKKKRRKGCLIAVLIVGALAILFSGKGSGIPNGYYRYNGHSYYHQRSSWYQYNDQDGQWYQWDGMGDQINRENADQYRTNDFTGNAFEATSWYVDDADDDYDWDDDDDYSWDDDDWDSDDSDWDSDW